MKTIADASEQMQPHLNSLNEWLHKDPEFQKQFHEHAQRASLAQMPPTTEHTMEQVIKDLTELFKVNEDESKASFVLGPKFSIDKQFMERNQVIQQLQIYFQDKTIKGGYCDLDPITMVHTQFEIKKGTPPQKGAQA